MNAISPNRTMEISQQDISDMQLLATDIYENKARAGELVMRIKNKLINAQLAERITTEQFYRITASMSSQMRSPLWQKHFIKKYGFNRVPVNEDRGDMEKNGNYYEYKASGFNARDELNLIQIRLWHNCDYILQFISGDGAKTFNLTKQEMQYEMEIHNTSSAHGTRRANQNNENIEFRMTITKETMETDWASNYFIADPFQIGVNAGAGS